MTAAFALLAGLPCVALAQPPASAVPFNEVATTQEVSLFVKQGRLLKLPAAAAKIMVADPKVASFQVPSPDSVFVFAEAAGSTSLYAMDGNDRIIAAIRLNTGYDLEKLRRQLNDEIPGANIEFASAAGNGLIVRGKVRTPIEARQVMASVNAALGAADNSVTSQGSPPTPGVPRIINQLQVELSAQVNIRVRVVEVSRSLNHQLGLNWDAVINSGKFTLDLGAAAAASNSVRFTDGNLTGVLNAMSEEGMATLLAEPNLTAMSGETAGFAAGGEVPVVIITNNSVNIDYKAYGVILRMTPTLLSPNRISLRIAPEVSDLADEGSVTLEGGSLIPALKVRRAETTVELASGQSFALAGMLRSNASQQSDGIPGIRKIPGVGRLFESETSSQEDTELVILATAYVVDPVNESQLQVPGRGLPMIDAQMPARASAGYLY
ncbi:type II and III secretion system protein family protein [Pseudomonas sp. LJDD11]|uniref:type II and III secretion system protein family protein n=1 Tax=Pseudomonas sp. LJDD11 TaxID=2931984 RepID=UPI00211C1E79|nr:type II and III secretion system protein family protein [Pseudomonas sp. LJDD11]MCQ9427196.1 type II and III secretion system protein family protein [Pseudomonas sp. LJDD11]